MNRRERLLGIGASAAVLLLLFKWQVIDVFRDAALAGRQADARAQELRVVTERIGMRDEIEALWAPYAQRFSAQSPDQAAAEFDRDVRQMVQETGISTPSGSQRPPTARGPFSSIPVQYQFTCTNENLSDLLYALSVYDGFLRIESLQIQSQWRPSEDSRAIQVTLEVSTLGGGQ